jgi:hypothetical protein
MTRTTLINIGIVIAVVFIVVVVMPYAIYDMYSSTPVIPNDSRWNNYTEHVYVSPQLEEPSPFFGMLKMLVVVGFLAGVGTLICIALRGPYEPKQDELFDRWDGRQ